MDFPSPTLIKDMLEISSPPYPSSPSFIWHLRVYFAIAQRIFPQHYLSERKQNAEHLIISSHNQGKV